MTFDEFSRKSDDWRKGYAAYLKCCVIEEEKSKDWWLGFDYACRYAKSDEQNGEYPFVYFAKKEN